STLLSRTNSSGTNLNVAQQRPGGGRAGKPAINCQASNKAKGSVERLGLLFFLRFIPRYTDTLPQQNLSLINQLFASIAP
ncbi:hypothetical protein, partial [Raoultella sp. RIT712]|uniref:hypothetical protein n=1 Tax=Raoultella sp. RIT712 TaxID=2666191 RepID=UPI001D0D9E1E